MAKKRKSMNHNLMHFVAWLTGVIVSLSVGFAMIDGKLSLPYWLGGSVVAMIAGGIVIITTAISVILAILNYMK